MAYETKSNTGAIFPNRNKMSDNHPDMSGNARVEIECPHCAQKSQHDFAVSLWTKVAKSGSDWWSAAFKLKSDLPVKQNAPVNNGPVDNIPF